MLSTRLIAVTLFGILSAYWICPELLHAQQNYFLDDFEDGSVVDNTPVSWEVPQYAVGGSRTVVNGSYVLQGPSGNFPFGMDTDVAGATFRDVQLRSQFRLSGDEQVAGVYLLSTLKGPLGGGGTSGYQLDGELRGNANGDLTIIHFPNGVPTPLVTTTLGYDPTGIDMRMDLELRQNIVNLTAWRDGTVRPLTPTLTYDLSPIRNLPTQGRIGIYSVGFDRTAANQSVEFRFFEAVPEPSSGVLALIGGLGSLLHARRRGRKSAIDRN